jgi:hypothetical protein
MTMSGNRMDPSRQCLTAIGDTRQLPEKILATPFVAAPASPPGADAAFGLLMEVETQPAVGDTCVVVHRLAASPASGKHVFALDGLTAMGSVESQLKPWALAVLKVREGVLLMYLTGLFVLIGGEINAEIEHASQDGKAPGEKQLPRP